MRYKYIHNNFVFKLCIAELVIVKYNDLTNTQYIPFHAHMEL